MTVATPANMQDQIATLVDQGVSLEEIEADVLEPEIELSDEERSALWLFAWGRERRNRELRRMTRRRAPTVPGS